jgi:hypothetical protein
VAVEKRRERKWWEGWGGLVSPLATAFAYVAGYASMSYFASTLSVSPGDLGLDFRDYLFLAGLTALVWIPVVGLPILLAWLLGTGWFDGKHGGVGVLSLFGVIVLFLGVSEAVSGGNFTLESIFVGVSFVIIVALGIAVEANTTTMWPVLAAFAFTVVILSGSTMLASSRSWAKSLIEDAKAGTQPSQGPFPIRLVLQPEIGNATIQPDGVEDSACVLRISERVFLGAETVVVRDVESFTSSTGSPATGHGCTEIDPVPWSSTSEGSTTTTAGS